MAHHQFHICCTKVSVSVNTDHDKEHNKKVVSVCVRVGGGGLWDNKAPHCEIFPINKTWKITFKKPDYD